MAEYEAALAKYQGSEDVRVVSLGSWCGVRGVVREMGLAGSNLPFDWLRCSLDGVIHAIRTDFQEFLSYDYIVSRFEREQPVGRDYLHDSADESILPFKDIYVSWGHSFWHDDLDLQEEQEKYQRRIERFRDLKHATSTQPLLFVRAANATTELAGIHLLHDLISEHFGKRAHLLLMLNHQPSHCAIFFDDRPTLHLQTFGHEHDDDIDAGLHGMKPLYRAAITAGIAFARREQSAAACDQTHSVRYASLPALLRDIKGGLFEDVALGEDLSKQWAHVPQCAQISGADALSLFDAVQHCLFGADVRRSPWDGKLYEFAGLLRTCTPGWSTEDVHNFWQKQCTQMLLERDSLDMCGNPQEATETSVAQGMLRRHGDDMDSSKRDNDSQLRRNPYDGKVYNFENLVEECAPHWTREEVADFWALNCVPLNTRENSSLHGEGSAEGLCAGSLRVISLGSHCGLKHALIRMGVSSATFPFDWLRTSLDSIIQALSTDFDGFVDYKQAIPHYDRPRILNEDEIAEDNHTPFEVVYACDCHAFWHSICWDTHALMSCHRRVRRLLQLRNPADMCPLLFVRAANVGSELGQLDELLHVLKSQFGEDVYLLQMLTSQPSYETFYFSDNLRVVVATLGSTYNESEEYMGVIPLYHDAIWDMIWYIQKGRRAKSHVELACVASIEQHLGSFFDVDVDFGSDTKMRWSPSPFSSEDVAKLSSVTLPLTRTAISQIIGNASTGFQRLCPDLHGVCAVSLGSWCGVKTAMQEVGFDRANLPFDWIRCSLDGVIHALSTDFIDFLQYDHVICRHEQDAQFRRMLTAADAAVPSPPRHEDIYVTWGWSFWYDNLTSDKEMWKYAQRIQRLRQLRVTQQRNSTKAAPLLFIRAASSSGELRRASDLLKVLEEQFGKARVNLLMLVSYQPRHCLLFFDDHPTLLVQTFSRDHEDLPGMLPLYADAITRALDFVITDERPSGHEAHSSLACFLTDTQLDQHGQPVFQEIVLEEDLTRQWSPLPSADRALVQNSACVIHGSLSRVTWDAAENRMYEIVE